MTYEDFESAIRDFNKADVIEKGAKELRDGARAKILTYLDENKALPSAGSGKQEFTLKDGMGVKITVPVKEGLPSRFDTERTEEFYRLVEDALSSDLVREVFKQNPEFLPERWMAVIKRHPDRASHMASMLLPYVLPATEPEPMSPRVEKR